MDVTVENGAIVIANLRAFSPALTNIVVRAINRSITSARAAVVPAMAADLGLKQKDVRDALKFRKATWASPEARIAASLKRIPLIDFNARGPEPSKGRGRGVTYKLSGTRGRLEQAFIVTLRSGHRGVFMRKAGSTHKSVGAWSKNLPLDKEKKGPSLGHVFKKYLPLGLARAKEAMATNLKHELSFAWTGGNVEALGAEGAD